ncbi:MAG: hypothetical protein WBV77_15010 [Solirubrobacteraceae bacterium]
MLRKRTVVVANRQCWCGLWAVTEVTAAFVGHWSAETGHDPAGTTTAEGGVMVGKERPPFEPGNDVALRHGAYSERAIAERAEQVHGELLAVAPYLDEPRFIPAVQRYLSAASREALLDEHIRTVTAEKGAGAVPARAWEQATAAARLAAKLGSDLGLDPIGHARIRALSAGAEATESSLTDLAAEGRRVRIAAEQRIADAGVTDDAESGEA